VKRALLAILILANVGIYAWVHWYPQPGSAQPGLSPAPGGQPLQLMSELSSSERKALATASAANPIPSPAPATVPTQFGSVTVAPPHTTGSIVIAAPGATTGTALVCVSYGPFPSADAVTQGLARLKAAGDTGSQRELPGKAKLGYWVYLPPFGSKREADAASALLKQKGVKDIYVVTDEANRNAVSLGVFSVKAGAEQREAEIKKLGYRSRMAERFRDTPHYWLDAKGATTALPDAEAFKDLGDEGSPIGKASSSCGA
jgi:hypothetical protein